MLTFSFFTAGNDIFAEAEESFDRRQMKRLQEESARERARKALESYDEKHRNTTENRPN